MIASDTCPVCSMKAEPDVPSVAHHKMYFHFCSEQCRQTFLARPSLYITQSGKKERGDVIKRRTMRLSEPLDHEVTEPLIAYLTEMMGVNEVVIDGDKVHITYDLLQITEKQIEEGLAEVGLQLGDGWLERLRRGWVHDSEEIELDNQAAPPAPSYHRPPH